MNIVYYKIKKCAKRNGDVEFAFKELVGKSSIHVDYVEVVQSSKNALCFTRRQISALDKNRSLSKKYSLVKGRAIEYGFPIDCYTKIIVHNVGFKEVIELVLYANEVDEGLKSELNAFHVDTNAVEHGVEEKMPEIKPFYMVFADKPNKHLNTIPTVKHSTEQEAETEAIRIADKEKCECYVFKAIKKVSLVPNVETIK